MKKSSKKSKTKKIILISTGVVIFLGALIFFSRKIADSSKQPENVTYLVRKETFENVSSNNNNQTTNAKTDGKQNIIQLKSEDLSPEAKAANDALIAKYNAPVELEITKKQEGKLGDKICWTSAIYGIKNNSLISNDEIEISFVVV